MEEDIWQRAKKNAADIIQGNNWVQWIHEGTQPAMTFIEKKQNADFPLQFLKMHCAKCINMNLCCFPRNNMPEYPLHPNCHCKLKPTNSVVATAECRIDKFTEYIFDDDRNNGKKVIFEDWGYYKEDSEWLKQEFERQAKEKYASGNFTLADLKDYGQMINIIIELPLKNSIGAVTFVSGWMVYPNGNIQLTTPWARREL